MNLSMKNKSSNQLKLFDENTYPDPNTELKIGDLVWWDGTYPKESNYPNAEPQFGVIRHFFTLSGEFKYIVIYCELLGIGHSVPLDSIKLAKKQQLDHYLSGDIVYWDGNMISYIDKKPKVMHTKPYIVKILKRNADFYQIDKNGLWVYGNSLWEMIKS